MTASVEELRRWAKKMLAEKKGRCDDRNFENVIVNGDELAACLTELLKRLKGE